MTQIKKSQTVEEKLRQFSFFEAIDDATLAELATRAKQLTFEKDEIVFHEADSPGGIYFVEQGWLKAIKVSRDGREQILDTLGPGYAINAHNIFTGSPMLATLAALENSVLWYIPADVISELIKRKPAAAEAIIRTLAQRIEFLVSKVEDLSLRTVDARLAKYLLANEVEGVVERQRWATQSEMAAHLGTVLDVLNRSLRKLEDKKIIAVERQRIRIVDEEMLATIAAE
jgi:CRP/FNR family transcriptional regulator